MKTIKVQSRVLTGKPTRKTPLGRPRRRCEDNIIMYLKRIDIKARNWIDSAKLEIIVNTTLNFRIP